jgi:hypothetical protein
MTDLTANGPNDLPFSIQNANGTKNHTIGVHGSVVRFHAHCGKRVSQVPLGAFVDYARTHGTPTKSAGSNTRFPLHDDSGTDAGWISFTATHVVMKDPYSRHKRELDFDALKDAVESVERETGGAA